MTDAKEPEVIAQLLHSEECGRSVLYDVYGNAICIIAAILDHIDTLTRECADRAACEASLTEWNEQLTRERDEARDAFDTVISLAPIYCEHLHHTKKDYHKSGEPCPVEARIKTLIKIIEGDA
jgi:hypothetical protein